MKRSTKVALVLSGSLMGGCGPSPSYAPASSGVAANGGIVTSEAFGDFGETNSPAITNNTFVAGRGYYHAPYRSWHPFPYNYFSPGFGYYHGGGYTPTPHQSTVTSSRPSSSVTSRSSSRPSSSSVVRGGFTRSSHSFSSASS